MKTKFLVYCNGDSRTGVPPQMAEICMDMSSRDPSYLDFVKKTLTESFSDIWDETAFVQIVNEFGPKTDIPTIFKELLSGKKL